MAAMGAATCTCECPEQAETQALELGAAAAMDEATLAGAEMSDCAALSAVRETLPRVGEAAEAEKLDGATGFEPFAGVWFKAKDGREMCEISGDTLRWSGSCPQPRVKLRLSEPGAVTMAVDGESFVGHLAGPDMDRLHWCDGDVWQRGVYR